MGPELRSDVTRALMICAFVGSLLSLIHGDGLFAGTGWSALRHWQLYANYIVPFSVSLVSSRLSRTKGAP